MRMQRKMRARLTTCLGSIIFLGCSAHKFEKDVIFGGPPGTRVERVRKYSLEEQFKIFRYGVEKVEPPLMGLADPIAERGVTAVPFLLNQLNSKPDDAITEDALLIFERMAFSKSYDVKSDAGLTSLLQKRISAIRDKEWRKICEKQFERIKHAP